MIQMTLAQIARAVGGQVHGDPGLTVTGAAYVDSRSPETEGLFVAVVGERSDGHAYADHAHAVLGSRPTSRPTVVVPDPVVALGRLARHVLGVVEPDVLAITGSSGKTGTKDLLAHLLPDAVATTGNANNELGVPLTVLRAGPQTRTLVLEMGARGVGHLSYLADVAPPTLVAVLGVGSAHLGEFGSRDLLALAKGEPLEALPAKGTAVLNADDPVVAAMAARTVARVTTFGRAGQVSWSALRLDERGRARFDLVVQGRRARVRLRATGTHQVPNAAAAAAMALAQGLDLNEVADRLSTASPVSPGRLQSWVRADGLLVLDDTYNANPESVYAALDALVAIGRRRSGRTVAVLGEMCELGEWSPEAHRVVGEHARRIGVDHVLAVGAAAAPMSPHRVPDATAAAMCLRDRLRPDDVVLVKASRAAALECLVLELTEGQ